MQNRNNCTKLSLFFGNVAVLTRRLPVLFVSNYQTWLCSKNRSLASRYIPLWHSLLLFHITTDNFIYDILYFVFCRDFFFFFEISLPGRYFNVSFEFKHNSRKCRDIFIDSHERRKGVVHIILFGWLKPLSDQWSGRGPFIIMFKIVFRTRILLCARYGFKKLVPWLYFKLQGVKTS